MEKITLKTGFARALEDYRKIGDAEMVAFFEKRLEQASKKHATGERKPTAHQLENEQIKQGILDNMEVGVKYTINDMLLNFNCFPQNMTPQRVSALLTQLGAKGTNEIVRSESKGKAYFSLA